MVNELLSHVSLDSFEIAVLCVMYIFLNCGSGTISGRGSNKVSPVWMVIQIKYCSSVWYYEVFHSDE